MAKLPTIKKILKEDLKGSEPWINPVIEAFNSLAELTYQALNGNITFSENVACFVKEIVYKTTAGYPAASDVTFMNELKFKATGVQVLQAVDKSNYSPAAGPVYVPWVEDSGKIVIKSITGLAPSKTYLIRLLIS